MYTIYICANEETICDGCTDERTNDCKPEISEAYTRTASDAVLDCRISGQDVDCELSYSFADWHGGRHDRANDRVGGVPFGFRAGLVAVHGRDLPQWVRDIADHADAEGRKAMDKFIAELEADARYQIVDLDGSDDFLGGAPASTAWFATESEAEAAAQELAEEWPGSRFAIRNAAGQIIAEVQPAN